MAVLVERDHIGIFGCMNAGKSSLLNLLVQNEASIVDKTPGTTADTKEVLFEIHGIGPVKIFDTAGIDEAGELGQKKRKKVYQNLKESDLVIVVVDPSRESFEYEYDLIKQARENNKQILIVFNIFDNNDKRVDEIVSNYRVFEFYPHIKLKANNPQYRKDLINFILKHYIPLKKEIPVIPFLKKDNFYVLIIPMDEETPHGRYLRPQAMVEEYLTRNWAYPVSFRLDLKKARENDKQAKEEYERFNTFLNAITKQPHCIITDSQAMDIMSKWCPPNINLTTFSIVMINYQTGMLERFVKGLIEFENNKDAKNVLIAEACNHSRIAEDIGTVQIPNILKKKYPHINVEHNFGREFKNIDEIKKYDLIIHCGGCMISRQKLLSRLKDIEMADVPVTNYGIFLSYAQGRDSLFKVIKPFNIKIDE